MNKLASEAKEFALASKDLAKKAIDVIKKDYFNEFGIDNSVFISTVGSGAKILE